MAPWNILRNGLWVSFNVWNHKDTSLTVIPQNQLGISSEIDGHAVLSGCHDSDGIRGPGTLKSQDPAMGWIESREEVASAQLVAPPTPRLVSYPAQISAGK